jgi:hypothetical protein
MSMIFAIPDAIYHHMACYYVRRRHSRARSAVRLLYMAMLLSTLWHVYFKIPTRAQLAMSYVIADTIGHLKRATRPCGW